MGDIQGDYWKLKAFVEHGRGKKSRKVPSKRSTWIHLLGQADETLPTIGIQFHNTYVVKIEMNEWNQRIYRLNTNGWHTNTTKERICEYSPARVYQRNFDWFIHDPQRGEIPFVDGIKVDMDGCVISPANVIEAIQNKAA